MAHQRIMTFLLLLALGGITVSLTGCAALSPRPVSGSERRASIPQHQLPLQKEVVVRFNQFQIPYIFASSDHDLGFTLGLLHMHLREGQLALLKRISQGRISEMAGPFTRDIDQALRILNLGRAVPEIEAMLPDETREFLEAFVSGLNYYQAHAPEVPPEYGILGIEREPWTVADVIRLSRLAGADVNWLVYFSLLKAEGSPAFHKVWSRIRHSGSDGTASFSSDEPSVSLESALRSTGRNGSNTVVVSSMRSASGAPLIASDPHLGMNLPNFWILAGLSSPSWKCVGLMIPGVPFVGLGRNPDIAWGGTNMRAQSSDLVDVSTIPASEITSRTETIGTRGWFDSEVTVRETRYGPIVSDAELLGVSDERPVALRWTGHAASDEITAFLRAGRATTAAEFRQAFAEFAVSGQNILYAHRDGTIGQLLAVKIPQREPEVSRQLIRSPQEVDKEWSQLSGASDLPAMVNPEKGFLASANNRPVDGAPRIGFLFSASDRIDRLKAYLEERRQITVPALKLLQRDTVSVPARHLARKLADRLPVEENEPGRALAEELRSWDGSYASDSEGALSFEVLLSSLLGQLKESDSGALPLGEQWSLITAYLTVDIDRLNTQRRVEIFENAIDDVRAARRRWTTWGEVHRLVLGHPLKNIPLFGNYFQVHESAGAGSRETIMKSAHPLVEGVHSPSYGSQSRHVSDLSDPDENYFVLLGGEDGWLGSDHFADQVPLWQAGKYIRMPLRAESVEREFQEAITLVPAPKPF